MTTIEKLRLIAEIEAKNDKAWKAFAEQNRKT